LWLACRHGHVDVVAVLVLLARGGLDINRTKVCVGLRGISQCMTCPYHPMLTKSLQVVCVWMPSQFDDGSTPLIAAAEHGHVAVVDALIAAGAKLNECKVGCTTHSVTVCLCDPWVSNTFLQRFLLQCSHMSGHGSVVAELRLRLAKSVGGPVSFPHCCRCWCQAFHVVVNICVPLVTARSFLETQRLQSHACEGTRK
jgi:hypothetical protein